jgi:hypothetical protein
MMEVYVQFEPLADFTPEAVRPGQCLREVSVGRTLVCKWLYVETEPHFADWNKISILRHESTGNVTELSR